MSCLVYLYIGTHLKGVIMRVEKFEIVNENNEVVATLGPASKGAGLWITGPTGNIVAIYAIENQTAVGIYKDKNSSAMDVALTVDGIQFVENEEVNFLSFKDLKKVVDSFKDK